MWISSDPWLPAEAGVSKLFSDTLGVVGEVAGDEGI